MACFVPACLVSFLPTPGIATTEKVVHLSGGSITRACNSHVTLYCVEDPCGYALVNNDSLLSSARHAGHAISGDKGAMLQCRYIVSSDAVIMGKGLTAQGAGPAPSLLGGDKALPDHPGLDSPGPG